MSDTLKNKGITIIGENTKEKKPIIVIGTARGGTSMVAGALAKLGVFMGDGSTPPVFEDVRISEKFESGNAVGAKKIAKEYSESHEIWGWKRPSAIDYLEEVNSTLNNPKYIFIYKDIFSIAQRNSISMLSEFIPGMEKAINQYGKTISFLKSHSPTAMLLSYDKALADPQYFVKKLADFSVISPSEDQFKNAISFIRPDPDDYLDASRITKAQGRLDRISDRKIYGWARHVHTKSPATVEIFINDSFISSVIANEPRPDLLERLNQACAFNFTIPDDIQLREGDSIRARAKNEVRDLDNSPIKAS